MDITTIIIYAAAVALVIFGIVHTVRKAEGRAKSCCGTPEIKSVRKVSDTDENHYPYRYILTVDGMRCSGCAANVENALNNIEGVWTRVDLGRREAQILAKSEHKEEDFAQALSKTSYRITEYKEIKK